MSKLYKLVVYVPASEADKIREFLGQAGAGRIGNYDYASFSLQGIGRFRPLKGAKPTIGEQGKIEEVEEERIETIVRGEDLEWILKELRKNHPYEEPAIDVYPLAEI